MARRARSKSWTTMLAVVGGALLGSPVARARADEPPAPTPAPAPGAGETQIQGTVDLEKDVAPAASGELAGPTPEAPPPPPYKKTLVLDSSIGAMGFLGQFGKVSPWGPWLHTQLGYEVLSWLMFFGEGDLMFTDTSNRVQPPETRSFPIFGFGGGARLTIRFTDRLGIYAQGSIGGMKADVGQNVLGLFGFRDAESLGVYLGGRLGLEWYQVDRHFALGLTGGIKTPQGFARTGPQSGTAAAVDAGLSLRYAF